MPTVVRPLGMNVIIALFLQHVHDLTIVDMAPEKMNPFRILRLFYRAGRS
jgi:hypothetical protein